MTMSFVPNRRGGPELIDLPPENYSHAEYIGNLADQRTVNRFLGDYCAVLKHLKALVSGLEASPGRPIKVLDVAAGSADIAAAIVKWARRHGLNIAVTAADNNPVAVREATALTQAFPELTVVVADGLSLPFEDGSFDIVMCSKTLHHFTEEDTVKLLQEVNRVASAGCLVMDLRRSWLAWLLISMLTRLFSRNRLTQYDGPLSVLRAYTVSEMQALSRRAGLAKCRVAKEPFWLMVVSWRRA